MTINIIFIPRNFIDCSLQKKNTNYYSSYRFRAQIFTKIERSREWEGGWGGDVDHLYLAEYTAPGVDTNVHFEKAVVIEPV